MDGKAHFPKPDSVKAFLQLAFHSLTVCSLYNKPIN